MALEIQGKIKEIYDTNQVTDRFRKREFVVEIADGMYPEFVKMQLTQDKCSLLDNFKIGDDVKVAFNLRGRPYTRDGVTTYFTNIDAWRVEPAGGTSSASAAPAASSSKPKQSAPSKPAEDMSGMSFSESGDDELPF